MAVSVLEVARNTVGGTSQILSFATVPNAGDTIVVKASSLRGSPRTATGVTGYGATFTELYQPAGSRVSYWIGTADGSTTGVQVAWSGSIPTEQVTIYRVTGLTSLTGVANGTAATALTLTGPTLSAGSGQLVISAATVASSAAITFPSAKTPAAGWTSYAAQVGASAAAAGDAYRIPGSDENHRTDVSTDLSSGLAVATIVIGSVAAPVGTEITLAGTAAPATATFDLTHTPAPVDLTLAGTAQAATASLALDFQPPPPASIDLTLAGTAQAATAAFALSQPVDITLAGTAAAAQAAFSLSLDTGVTLLTLAGTAGAASSTFALDNSFVVVESSTRWANDGYNMGGLADVIYEPAVEPDPAGRGRAKVRRVHQSLPAPTLVDGRPT